VHQGERSALLVDGKPFLILGAQMANSSEWASTLPAVWTAVEKVHANTLGAPVYWEREEPSPGVFDFSDVDELIPAGARTRCAPAAVVVRRFQEMARCTTRPRG
jgi:hypothetical protein